jgi:hypothetical protein
MSFYSSFVFISWPWVKIHLHGLFLVQKWQINYLCRRFFLRNTFFILISDDNAECVSSVISDKWKSTSFGLIGNNVVSIDRTVSLLIDENGVDSDGWDWLFNNRCCLERQ